MLSMGRTMKAYLGGRRCPLVEKLFQTREHDLCRNEQSLSDHFCCLFTVAGEKAHQESGLKRTVIVTFDTFGGFT